MVKEIKKTGIKISSLPRERCSDANCPFHGSLKLRGKSFVGTVTASRMQKSAKVMWEGSRFVPKYERFKKTRSNVTAHNPPCVNAKEGDKVKITECRPISKTKHFAIIEVLGKEAGYEFQKGLEEMGKHKEKEKVKKGKEERKSETEESVAKEAKEAKEE